eukprot:5099400-Amphidinium_carterae.1
MDASQGSVLQAPMSKFVLKQLQSDDTRADKAEKQPFPLCTSRGCKRGPDGLETAGFVFREIFQCKIKTMLASFTGNVLGS